MWIPLRAILFDASILAYRSIRRNNRRLRVVPLDACDHFVVGGTACAGVDIFSLKGPVFSQGLWYVSYGCQKNNYFGDVALKRESRIFRERVVGNGATVKSW